MADSGGSDLYSNLSGFGRGKFHVDVFEWLVRGAEDDGFNGSLLSALMITPMLGRLRRRDTN